jgi:hypothetical protein
MVVAPLCGQTDTAAAPAGTDETMQTPSPVNLNGNVAVLGSELERSNYLRGGLAFEGAYDDNILPGSTTVGDASYTLSPFLALDIQRARLKWNMKYAPGFTFYQKYSSFNQSNHDFSTDLQYRISPHVTMALQGSVAKASVLYGQFTSGIPGGVPSGAQVPNLAIVSPVTDTLTDGANGQLTYQFARNAMVGASGNFSELRYLDSSQVQGLFDSSSRGAQMFYSHRLSGRHYIGFAYNFADLFTFPINSETQVHSATAFYTIYWGPHTSFSLFGGAQHSDTSGGGFVPMQMWSPTAGGSMNWQGVHTSFTLDASRRIMQGGGLSGATEAYAADVSVRHQLTSKLTAAVSAGYSDQALLDANPLFSVGGHSVTGTATLERTFGTRFTAGFGYSRIDQSYANIAALSSNPNRNRGWVSFSYNFERPLGQ